MPGSTIHIILGCVCTSIYYNRRVRSAIIELWIIIYTVFVPEAKTIVFFLAQTSLLHLTKSDIVKNLLIPIHSTTTLVIMDVACHFLHMIIDALW